VAVGNRGMGANAPMRQTPQYASNGESESRFLPASQHVSNPVGRLGIDQANADGEARQAGNAGDAELGLDAGDVVTDGFRA